MSRTTPSRSSAALALLLAAGAAAFALAVERVRPPMPKITAPVMFDTPEADAILAALQVFPPDNWWNRDVSGLPVHPTPRR